MAKRPYEYDNDLDILYIYNNPKNDKPEYNLTIGTMVIDVGMNGKVLGVEVDCASKIFPEIANYLNDLSIARIVIRKTGNATTFGILLAKGTNTSTYYCNLPEQSIIEKELSA